jgi:DNA-directed RNA polymerase specialized sigma24 family protein
MGSVDFEAWYRAEYPKVLSALTVVAWDVGRAQDAVDEAFTRAYERWGRVGQMAGPAGWTYRTALNVLRRKGRRSAVERLLHVGGWSGGESRPADWSSEVWELLRALPVRERTAVALRYVADLSTAEIAEVMGIAPGTVGSTLHSARARLASSLADRADDGLVPPAIGGP